MARRGTPAHRLRSTRGRLVAGGVAGVLVATLAYVVTARTATAATCPAVAPTPAEAVAAAVACGRPVEIGSAGDEESLVFANPDGTTTMQTAPEPQRVRQASGWTPIDLTLRADNSGSVAPVASAADVRFSGGGSVPLVTFTKGGRRFWMYWMGALPEPELSGDTATYTDVLPGVDLTVRATETGFSQVLVIKSATAANPAVQRFAYQVGGVGASLTTTVDGGFSVVGDDGSVLLTSEGAAAWDSSDAAAPGSAPSTATGPSDGARLSQVPATLSGNQLVLTPDAAFLSGATAASYPLYVDPQFSSPTPAVWAYSTNNNSNNTDTSVARVGVDPSSGVMYRSFFRFPMSANGVKLAGTHIMSATVHAVLTHSWSCASTPVYLYRSGGIASTPRTGWSPALQLYLNGQSAHAHKGTNDCGNQPDVSVNFNSTTLNNDVQAAANASWTNYTVALSARDSGGAGETATERWKKFKPNTVYLSVTYNSYPTMSGALSGGQACLSGSARPVLPSATPVVSTVVNDVDTGQSLKGVFSYSTDAGATWKAAGTSLPQLTGLRHSVTLNLTTADLAAPFITWRVGGNDGTDNSTTTTTCEFTVDTSPPPAPAASSTRLDLSGSPATAGSPAVGSPSAVTFRPAAGETGVAGYRFGVGTGGSNPPLLSYVPARQDGTAVAAVSPVTDDALVGDALTVAEVDRGGNTGAVTQYTFFANSRGTARVRGDVSGDGRADVLMTADAGGAQLQAWSWIADPTAAGAFVGGPTNEWDSGPASIYTGATTTVVSGDFDGDGIADQGVLHNEGTNHTTFAVFRGTSDSLLAPSAPQWDSVTAGGTWSYAAMKIAIGDVDADGRDDLVVLYNTGTNAWKLSVLRSTSSPGAVSFAMADWSTGGTDWNKLTLVAGDLTGDGRADAAVFYQVGTAQTQLWMYASKMPTQAAFAAGVSLWDSGAGNWTSANAKYVLGDVTGDGRTDIVALYNYGSGTTKAWVWNGTAPATQVQWWADPAGAWTWDLAAMQPSTGDFNNDGKADLAIVYRCCGNGQARLWTATSTGTALATPVLRWSGQLGVVGTGSAVADPTARYQVVSAQSGKCLTVPGSSTAEFVQLTQQACSTTALNELFAVTVTGGGQVNLQPAHVSGKCVGALHGVATNGTQIVQANCGAAWEWLQTAYAYGGVGGIDPTVQVKPMFSGSCLDVVSGSTADGALVQEWACNGNLQQNFVLHRVG